MWKIEFVEKLKEELLQKDWQTVSIYKMEDKVLVYINGELTIEYQTQEEPQEG